MRFFVLVGEHLTSGPCGGYVGVGLEPFRNDYGSQKFLNRYASFFGLCI